jgi:hypothetical protein
MHKKSVAPRFVVRSPIFGRGWRCRPKARGGPPRGSA